MNKYKDRYGNEINLGDTVLQIISCNIERHSSPYTVMIIKKRGNNLILDGVWGWSHLKTQKADDLCVLKPDTDIRKIHCDFLRLQKEEHNRYEDISNLSIYDKYIPHQAYKHLEEICKLAGHKGPLHEDSMEKLKTRIEILFNNKEIDEEKLNKVIEKFKQYQKIISGTMNLYQDMTSIFKEKT